MLKGWSLPYRWIMFDADGTLFDFDNALQRALVTTFRNFGHTYEPEYAKAFAIVDLSTWEEFERGEITLLQLRTLRFERLFRKLDLKLNPQSFSDHFLNHLAGNSKLLDGAESLLHALNYNIDLVLISNGLSDVQRHRIDNSALYNCFKHIVISEEVDCAKPDRAIFDHAFQLMQNPEKSDVLIVGDSLTSDIRGGYNYGIDTCWFNPSGLTRPESANDLAISYEIADLSELIAIVHNE